jgi:hypothetical protein
VISLNNRTSGSSHDSIYLGINRTNNSLLKETKETHTRNKNGPWATFTIQAAKRQYFCIQKLVKVIAVFQQFLRFLANKGYHVNCFCSWPTAFALLEAEHVNGAENSVERAEKASLLEYCLWLQIFVQMTH